MYYDQLVEYTVSSSSQFCIRMFRGAYRRILSAGRVKALFNLIARRSCYAVITTKLRLKLLANETIFRFHCAVCAFPSGHILILRSASKRLNFAC